MKLLRVAATIVAGLAVASSTAVPKLLAISIRDESAFAETSWATPFNGLLPRAIERRKGGGGRSSGSSGGSSGSSGGSSGSSGKSSNSGTSRSTGNAGSSSSIGPSYGRGSSHYAGGATVPFKAGGSSPTRRIVPFILAGAALGFFPGVWLYGAYVYPYTQSYHFINRTDTANNANGTNQTLPVTCLCAQYSACGCDEDDDLSYLDTFIGNGSVASLNSTLVNIANVNNTKTIVLNGTLPNGTNTESSSAVRSRQRAVEAGGFWVVGAIVGAMVWAL